MNKRQLEKLETIKISLRLNDLSIKDLVNWCESYKNDKTTINNIKKVFKLGCEQVVFILIHLDEITKTWLEENKEIIIWTGFKWTMEKGQTLVDIAEAYNDDVIFSYATQYSKITNLDGKTLLEMRS